jgi:D-lactate dehydrogenase
MLDRIKQGERFAARLNGDLPSDAVRTDPLYRFAYAGDASYFRLIPAAVVFINTEDDVRKVLAAARAENLPVTFRAAGTSLSGQAVTDGVLAVLGDGWRKIAIAPDAQTVALGPSIIVAHANAQLKRFNKKIGPDPASQATCKIGGVVANNSSGMCCGVAQNTYHTMARLRLMLADGTVLDSGDPESVAAFRESHHMLLAGLAQLHADVMADAELTALIKRKYRIKNTVGYALNALVDFHDPIDILIHLMVGSEGTLGFVSEVTYNTVPDHPFKSTAFVPFPDPHSCARAITKLSNGGVQVTTGVTAAEYIERRALATVEHLPAMAELLPYLDENSPAVLIDVTAPDAETLAAEVANAEALLASENATAINFSTDKARSDALWDIRKGFFASGGATRPKGTSMLTEDVAAPIDRLADFVIAMRELLDRHGYYDAIIFGHALAGNLHFQMSADFSDPETAAKFDAFSRDLSTLVSVDFTGSLKAEHGTGRAIAAFVEAEWGAKAYDLMKRIKALFDPENILNPGVLMTDDDQVHIHNLKPMPLADPIIDMCIECGFCEPACPSAGMTLSPRQRIAVTREIARLERSGDDPQRLEALSAQFAYAGRDTCAACNLCSLRCPVGIETGTMIIGKRAEANSPRAHKTAEFVARHAAGTETLLKTGLATQAFARAIVGDGVVDGLNAGLRKLTGDAIPMTSPALRPAKSAPKSSTNTDAPRGEIVYFPSCPSRIFDAPKTSLDLLSLPNAMVALLERAGYRPVVPDKAKGLCCGRAFSSKGYPEAAKNVRGQWRDEMNRLSNDGALPIVTDTSSCVVGSEKQTELPLALADSAEFLAEHVLPYLEITRTLPVVAVHHNCSAQRIKEQGALETLAKAIGDEIAVLSSVTCCGYAGDRGLEVPELNTHALRFAAENIPAGCEVGVTTVSTCGVGLTDHLDIPFVSIAALLEYATRNA